jgi:hypothetical protein
VVQDPTAIDPIAVDNAIDEADRRLQQLRDERARAENKTPVFAKVRGGGRYAVPATPGWPELNRIIKDKAFDLDYSPFEFPNFDGIVQRRFNSDEFINPLNANYEKWQNLRDNVAAVRNYLIMNYFHVPPEQLAAAHAENSLHEIATFVGDGLYNNFMFLGMIPNHDPTKPFVDIELANQPDGKGAAYIYERILSAHRQNNWLRPFAMITSLFGGGKGSDWKLPEIDGTPFGHENLTLPEPTGPDDATLKEAEQETKELRAGRAERRANRKILDMAVDLDSLGNQLLFSAENAQGVAGLSEPVRRDAIEIAKDILRKLKIKLGNVPVISGLNMKPEDDVGALGATHGVVLVYEKLLAYARSVDAGIMNHPAIGGATQAIGQLGYLAKLEALRLAEISGGKSLSENLSAQLRRIPERYSNIGNATFGDLLDRVERGIDTVLDRLQTITGPSALVGHSVEQNIQGFMNATPVAGQQMRSSLQAASSRDQQQKAMKMMDAVDEMQRMQAQRIQQSAGDSNTRSASRGQTGRQALQTARSQRNAASTRISTSSIPSPYAPINIRTNTARTLNNAAARMGYHHDDHHDEHHHPAEHVVARIDPRVLQGIKAATNATNLMGEPVGPRTAKDAIQKSMQQNAQKKPLQSFYAAPAAAAAKPPAVAGTVQPPASTAVSAADPLRPDMLTPPPMAPKGGGGRGF